MSPITPPSAPTNGALDRSATVTSSPRSRHTDAISEPMNPAPTISTRFGRAFKAACNSPASSLVRSVKRPFSLASSGLNHARDRTPVAISNLSYGTLSPLASITSWLSRSRPVAATPRRQSASIARIRGSLVLPAGTHPLRTCLDSGGRSYGSCTSSPMMVSEPVKPSSRNASAARSPAREAPTMTIRPCALNVRTRSSTSDCVVTSSSGPRVGPSRR
jgi:hypothetical protein